MGLYEVWLKYPQILEPKDWDKHKGVLAKVFKGETGIGEALKKARKTFEAINPAYFSETTVDIESKDGCAKAIQNIAHELNRVVKPCTDALKSVKDLAEKTAKEFQKNKLIPKSSRQHVERIADTAQQFADEIRQFLMRAKSDIENAAKTAV